jgi:hypothetical protein
MARQFSLGEVTSPREFAYSDSMQKIDEEIDQARREGRDPWRKHHADKGSAFRTDTKRVSDDETPNLVSSRSKEDPDVHYPVIDCDYPIAVVESRTPGHYHLFIEKALNKDQYEILLLALLECGLIGRGNFEQFNQSGATYARYSTYEKLVSEQKNEWQQELFETLTGW